MNLAQKRSANTIVCREMCSHVYKFFKDISGKKNVWKFLADDTAFSEILRPMLKEVKKLNRSDNTVSDIPEVKTLHEQVHLLETKPLNEWKKDKVIPNLDKLDVDSFSKGSVYMHYAIWCLSGRDIKLEWNPSKPQEQLFKAYVDEIIKDVSY